MGQAKYAIRSFCLLMIIMACAKGYGQQSAPPLRWQPYVVNPNLDTSELLVRKHLDDFMKMNRETRKWEKKNSTGNKDSLRKEWEEMDKYTLKKVQDSRAVFCGVMQRKKDTICRIIVGPECSLQDNTITIFMGLGFFGGTGVLVVIHGDSAACASIEWSDGDNLRYDENDTVPKRELTYVPKSYKITLVNKPELREDAIITGRVDMIFPDPEKNDEDDDETEAVPNFLRAEFSCTIHRSE